MDELVDDPLSSIQLLVKKQSFGFEVNLISRADITETRLTYNKEGSSLRNNNS